MTLEQYWHGDVTLLGAYAEADLMRRKRRNEEMWYQGYYVYQAVGAFCEILPAFPKKNAKIHNYLSSPIPWTQEEKDEIEEQAARKKYDALRKYLTRSTKKE